MKLHEAMRKVIREFGANLLREERFLNFLADYRAFDDFPAVRQILQSVVSDGYGNGLCELSLDGNIADYMSCADDVKEALVKKHHFKKELVCFAVDSISFALGMIPSVAEPLDHGFEPVENGPVAGKQKRSPVVDPLDKGHAPSQIKTGADHGGAASGTNGSTQAASNDLGVKLTAVIIGSVALIVLAVSLLGKDKHTVESAGESAFGAMATTESAAYERNAQTDGKTADIRKFSLTGDNAVAYAVGQSLGSYIGKTNRQQEKLGLGLDSDKIIEGFADGMNGKDKMQNIDKQKLLMEFDAKVKAKANETDENQSTWRNGEKALEEMARKEGDRTTKSGLQYKEPVKANDNAVAYAVGQSLGSYIEKTNRQQNAFGLKLDPVKIIEGFADGMNGKDKMQNIDKQKLLMEFDAKVMAKAEEVEKKKAAEEIAKGIKFLEENALKEGVRVTRSGLQYQVIHQAADKNAPKPDMNSVVTVYYKGYLLDGKVFDQNIGQDPIKFPLNAVIPGLAEGLTLMKKGAKYRFWIPSKLGYGDRAVGLIPANSVLVFQVELVNVQTAEEAKSEENRAATDRTSR